ncbi:hypothetical protein RND81_03G216200 [Saponaria officinalis]|uniref:1-phosphatidylinositol-4-phosphate 5-kinase n=1 Tax=Saponaria officinalis TaxID=3572 RepID=A0AAW1M9A9_SAPOF
MASHCNDDHTEPIKKTHKNEYDYKVLMELLPSNYRHLKKHSKSLLAKIYGLHAARPGTGGPKIYFVVMENLLQSELQIHRQYDVKGSSQGRNLTKVGTQSRLTLKDLEFDMCFYIDPSTRCQLLEQIKIDCNFLEEQSTMDYSLLPGVHIEPQNRVTKDERNCEQSVFSDDSLHDINGIEPRLCRDITLSDFFTNTNSTSNSKVAQSVKEGSTVSRNTKLPDKSSVFLYVGIIDFLQSYNVIKRLEHAYKSLQYDAKEISSVKPKLYPTRFQDFLSNLFGFLELNL